MGSREVYRILFFLAFGVVFLIPFISAIDTPIKVTTYANHDIMISMVAPGTVHSLLGDSIYGKSDGEGSFKTTLSAGSDFDLKIWVKNENLVVVSERFNGNTAGESLHLILFPGKIQIIKNYEQNETINSSLTNETEEVNLTVQNNSDQNLSGADPSEETEEADKASITGLAASEGGEITFSSKIIYYAIALIALGFLVFMGITKIRKRRMGLVDEPKGVKVKKFSKFKEEQKGKMSDYKKAIEDAERKIEEAKDEINKLKNADKIEEIKRRMIEDQKELMKLRSGK